MTTKIIKMFDIYGDIIGIRSLAESIFNDIDEDTDEILVDFDKVEFIGRSFTQEYIRQKKKQKAHIKEINTNEFIDNMIKWVIDTWR